MRLSPPVISYQVMYSGTALSTNINALTIVAKPALNSYRVSRVVFEVVSVDLTKSGKVQIAIRGQGGEDESNFSFPYTIGSGPVTVVVRQTRGSGYWSPTKENEHVAWIRNLGKTDLNYTAVVYYTSRTEFNITAVTLDPTVTVVEDQGCSYP